VSEELPGIGAAVVLRDQDGGEYRSQVQERGEGTLSVRRPAVLAPGAPVLIGDQLTVSWAAGDNLVGLVRARIATIRYAEAGLLWELAGLAEPWTEQRRQWVRVPAIGPVVLTERADAIRSLAPGVAEGELLDVSEVAVRCEVPVAAIWASRRGGAVGVRFELAGEPVEVEGTILASRVPPAAPSRREVVVRFEPPAPVAEVLRGYIRSSSG